MGMSGQHRTPAALYPRGKDPRYPLLGGWVGPRAGLDAETKGKSFADIFPLTCLILPWIKEKNMGNVKTYCSVLSHRGRIHSENTFDAIVAWCAKKYVPKALIVSVLMFQLENRLKDFDKIWYERHTIGGHPNLVLLDFL
jgi:hypothetical protein